MLITNNMPRKLMTVEEIQKAWERKRERDKKAQANWVAQHHDEHLIRMKAQYQKKKAKKEDTKQEVVVDKPMAEPSTAVDRIRKYKQDNPTHTQKQIAIALSISQSSISRALKL